MKRKRLHEVYEHCVVCGGMEGTVVFDPGEDKYSHTHILLTPIQEYGGWRQLEVKALPTGNNDNHAIMIDVEGSYERRALGEFLKSLGKALLETEADTVRRRGDV